MLPCALRWTIALGMSVGGVAQAARIPIGVVYGTKQTIVKACDLPVEFKAAVRNKLGTNVAVGFFYSSAQLFWCDVWTWGGKFVLFQGDHYWEVPDDLLSEAIGKEKFAGLSKPWSYHVPLGWLIIGGFVALCVLSAYFLPSDEERLKALMKNPMYMAALEKFHAKRMEAAADPTEQVKAGYQAALQHLLDSGVSEKKANANLTLLVQYAIAREMAERALAESKSPVPPSETPPSPS